MKAQDISPKKSEKKQTISCEYCSKKYVKLKNYEDHLKNKHENNEENIDVEASVKRQ